MREKRGSTINELTSSLDEMSVSIGRASNRGHQKNQIQSEILLILVCLRIGARFLAFNGDQSVSLDFQDESYDKHLIRLFYNESTYINMSFYL